MRDEESNSYPEREQHIFNEKVERDGGVFVEPQHQEVDCNQPGAECGPDEYPEDPFAIDNRPGTVDDIPHSYGVELPNADDQHLIPDGGVRHHAGQSAPDEEVERDLGERDERDLWRRQRPLIEEDVEDGIKLPGMDDDEAAKVVDMMGAEFNEEDQDETSATGAATTEPDHGGFPEREE